MGKTIHPSVNEATNPKVAPTAAMAELGNNLPRLIYTVANADEAQGPILFSKSDIKDSYWRMVVPADDEWNSAFVLPKDSPDEPTQLVIPSSLQIRWCNSPAYFCAASKTARDVGEKLETSTPIGSLPPHPLEHWLIHPNEWPANNETAHKGTLYRLLEVYVDDFIHLAQTTNATELKHLALATLHGLHSCFPPPSVTGHDGEDPVSLKKLKEGDGRWGVCKELLGWIFDGATRCIKLPPTKVEAITSELHSMSRLQTVPRKQFEKLQGKLRHACIGLPAGKGLMGPMNAALCDATTKFIPIRDNPPLRCALQDFGTLFKIMVKRPTHCRELVVGDPGYVGYYCDASKLGAGGVWLSGIYLLQPVVWRVEWLQDIRNNVVSFSNPNGIITNSDLEMAGMVLHYLVLEHLTRPRHIHIAAWCDNTPTVK
jgi:hypothetical protein